VLPALVIVAVGESLNSNLSPDVTTADVFTSKPGFFSHFTPRPASAVSVVRSVASSL